MIVLSDEDDQAVQKLREDRAGVAGPSALQPAPIPSASTRLLDPRPTGEPDFEAPPAYPGAGYQTFPQPPPRPYPISEDSLPPPASAESKRPETNTWQRFVKAVIVALILYALGTVLWALFSRRRDPWDGREWPKPPVGRYDEQECSTYYQNDGSPLIKKLPDAQDGLFFVTLGDQLTGSVLFVYDDSLRQGAQATIQASDHTKDQRELLAQTRICVLHNGKTQGVGISTPSKRVGSEALNINVTLSLPYAPYASPGLQRRLKSLRSNTKNFAHVLALPRERYFVDDVDFKTTNGPIVSVGIVAESVSFQTTSAFIEGEFSVSKLLKLQTTNGHIESSITAMNDPKRTKDTTSVILTSTNSPIKGQLNLQLATSYGTGGKFHVQAKTSNSPLVLVNEHLPLDAALTIDAHNTNSPVEVFTAPAFEGTFDLKTTNNAVVVKQLNDDDPAHRRRQRKVAANATGHRTKGFTSWSKDSTEQGNGAVSIASTNAPVTLYL